MNCMSSNLKILLTVGMLLSNNPLLPKKHGVDIKAFKLGNFEG